MGGVYSRSSIFGMLPPSPLMMMMTPGFSHISAYCRSIYPSSLPAVFSSSSARGMDGAASREDGGGGLLPTATWPLLSTLETERQPPQIAYCLPWPSPNVSRLLLDHHVKQPAADEHANGGW